MLKYKLAITSGEYSSIGSEIIIFSSWKMRKYSFFFLIGNLYLLKKISLIFNPLIKIKSIKIKFLKKNIYKKNELLIINFKIKKIILFGFINKINSLSIFKFLNFSIYSVLNNIFDAIITGPLDKSLINKIGFHFKGHTEYLENLSTLKKSIMMFINKYNFRLALITNHISIKKISIFINIKLLINIIKLINFELKNKFNIKNPIILITSLNPHIGEKGYIGNEEEKIIKPAIMSLKKIGIYIYGPYSADSIFQKKFFKNSDCVLIMYHDQCLPVLKINNFNNYINISLGLSIIRTSINHGTALDIAKMGFKKANYYNMINTIKITKNLVK